MSEGHRRGRVALVARATVLIVALGACSNSTGGSIGGGSGDPGVSATAIDVGSLANITGPVSADFAPITSGVQAYFDMVNAQGGV
jgi:branched-chain amino acid transport system substrate-binding protein